MKQKYNVQTQRILKKAYNVGIQVQEDIRKTNKFLKNLESDLLITEAEMIIRDYKNN